MPVAKLHRCIFLMLCAVIALLVAQLAYTTRRLNRLEAAVADVRLMAENGEEIGKEIRAVIHAEERTPSLADVGQAKLEAERRQKDTETVDIGRQFRAVVDAK
jgi:hypothetical protein